MPERVFLGWDRPLLGLVVDWLWARREEMAGMLVVVPTAQSGRRLREALAERGACLAPRVVTPGWFLRSGIPPSLEVLAWVEALEGVADWTPYESAFPDPPGAGEPPGWGMALGQSLHAVERALREGGHSIASAARRLEASPEGPRWGALAALAKGKDRMLQAWSRERWVDGLEARIGQLEGVSVVFAGVTEIPLILSEKIQDERVEVLIAAPESESAGFDAWGRPIEAAWGAERPLEWPEPGEVTLAADPEEQAGLAVERVAREATASDRLALGSADEETAEALVAAFGRAGWSAFNPAGGGPAPLAAWWSAWRAFLARPEAAAAIDLLGCREAAALVGGRRAQRVRALSMMRDRWLVRGLEDLERVATLETRLADEAELARGTLEALGKWRAGFLRKPFARAMEDLIGRIDADGAMDEVRAWLESMAVAIERTRRDAGFWLELLLNGLTSVSREAPDDRMVDVQGWLELLHEPGEHLVVCGLNEGKVPPPVSGDPWLPEGTRRMLGLVHEATRSARDAFLLRAMLEARRDRGRVDLLLAKSSAGGDALLPSRLLLACAAGLLPERVTELFRSLEPPDAGLEWQADWKWTPPRREIEPRMSVTAFGDYLACPFRFYLKHVAGSGEPEPERVEWSARDFGTVVHDVLEAWARDEEARDFSKTGAIHDWLSAELDRLVASRFGRQAPLAVRIQVEGLRQRLAWFARWQACQRAEGWRVEAVEEKFEFELGGVTVVGRVDRVDRHEGGARRILDYKTFGRMKKVEDEHRKAVTGRTAMPAHLDGVDAVLSTVVERGKPKTKRWTNLQVPLYAREYGGVSELGYYVLAPTEKDSGLSLWPDFGDEVVASATACAEWVISQVTAGVFGPAAERVPYDDYAALAMGRPLAEVVEMKGGEP